MAIQADSTQDVVVAGLCLACTREYLSETIPGIVFAEPGGVRAYTAATESVSLRVRMKS
jgi:hypothetical protein